MKRISIKDLIRTHLFIFLFSGAIVGAIAVHPLLSRETVVIPDVEAMREFSIETCYMSREGFVMSYVRLKYGREITIVEARRLMREASKERRMKEKQAHPERSSKSAIEDDKKGLKLIIDPAAGKKAALYWDDLSGKCADVLMHFRKFAAARPAAKAAALEVVDSARGRRVLVMPVNAAAGGAEASEYAGYFIKKRLAGMGYEVVDPGAEKFADGGKKEVVAAAKRLGADLVVFCDVSRYKRGKRFCLAGAIVDIAFLSYWNKADVSMSTKVFSVRKNSFVYAGSARSAKKHQVLGIFHSSKGVMAWSVGAAVDKLYEKLPAAPKFVHIN